MGKIKSDPKFRALPLYKRSQALVRTALNSLDEEVMTDEMKDERGRLLERLDARDRITVSQSVSEQERAVS